MRFKEYVERKIDMEIDYDEWMDDYDYYDDKYFQDYLDDMEARGYEPEIGHDY